MTRKEIEVKLDEIHKEIMDLVRGIPELENRSLSLKDGDPFKVQLIDSIIKSRKRLDNLYDLELTYLYDLFPEERPK